jgi:putative ABC transport system permease protein
MSRGIAVTSLRDDVTAGAKPALLAVTGAVILLLVIACVNVTNLLLARGAQRRGELAVRAVLGAGRQRLIRQLLTESLLLALIGGVLGMAVAEAGVRALVALSPAELPRLGAISVNGAVFLFALGATTLTGLVVGLVPALYASRGDLSGGLQQGSRRTAGGDQMARRTLVVAEVALALVLLVAAGLLFRSLDRLFRIAPGFDASHVLAMEIQVSGRRFNDDKVTRRFFDQTLDAVRRVPGVESAAFTSELPLSGEGLNEIYGITFEHDADPHDGHDVFRYAVSPAYFETMHIPLIRGRLFDGRDTLPTAVRPIVINESLAARKFRGLDPIGQRIRIGGANTRPWDEIVGVVGDVKQASLAAGQSNAAYATTDQWLWADTEQWLVVRTRGDAAAITGAIRNAVWSVDKDQPIVRVARMESLVAATEAARRFALTIFAAFALVALALAATGIYGVLSGSVAERTREIGVRAALGASRTDILALVVRQAMTLTTLGIALGVAGAFAVSRFLITLLYGVSRVDALTYSGVIAMLLCVSGIACAVPAWRAARVDPSVTLRAD